MAQETQPRPAPMTGRLADLTPAPATAERLTKTTAPNPRRDVGLAWLVLLGMVVLACAPLLIDIDRPAAWSAEEALAVAISSETHQRKTPITDTRTSLDAWTPVYQGVSRWDLPPGGVWLHQVMYLGAPAAPDISDDLAIRRELLIRARVGSVLMALLLIAAVFWAGHSIGGVSTGALAALAVMTMPLVVGFGRHATADIAAVAWATLSIAGALWAMRPLRASPSLPRQLIGWLVCGVGLGLAALTAGPRAVPATLLCTIVLAMVCPRRIGHVMGLIASTAIAALVLTPWVLHVHDHDPNVWQQWVDQLTPGLFNDSAWETLQRAGWRLSLAATLSGLWLVWLIPAVSQPFSTSTGSARRRLMLGWAWLVTASLLLALAPGPTRLGALLIAVAPASIAVGLVIQQFHDLSAEGRHARLWLVCRWISAGFMATLAIALPLLAYLASYRPDLLGMLPELRQPLPLKMHWSFYAGAALALLLSSALAVRFAIGHHPGRAAASLALWLLTAYTLATIATSGGPLLSTPATPLSIVQPQATP